MQNLRAAKTLSLRNLSAYITYQEAAKQPPPQSQGQAKEHTLDWGEQTGERGIYIPQSQPRHLGLGKVNNGTSTAVIDGTGPFIQ